MLVELRRRSMLLFWGERWLKSGFLEEEVEASLLRLS
jgi:hypothetical protein